MSWFSPKLPVTDDEREWVEQGFHRLAKLLGRTQMLDARVVTPTAEDFPDPFDRSAESAEKLFWKVCDYMDVKRAEVEVKIFPEETEDLSKLLPHWHGDGQSRAAGLFLDGGTELANGDGRHLVAIRSTQLEDPLALVATIAHELGHVILLGRKLLNPAPPDHEPLTDLLTVYLGLGIFTANSAARFKQWQDERKFGWSMNRLGYLSEKVYGYALAKFMIERGEEKPAWLKYLSTNVKSYCKQSRSWMEQNPQYVRTAKSIG